MIYKRRLATKSGTIVIADSCVGGIEVLKHLLQWAANYDIVFLADYEFNPFGLKTHSQVRNVVRSWLEFSHRNIPNVQALVIACNTATIAFQPIIREAKVEFAIPIITMGDGFGAMIGSSLNKISGKSVGLMGTQLTIQSGYYHSLLYEKSAAQIIDIIATRSEKVVASVQHLTPMGNMILSEELSPFSSISIESLVLACTCLEHLQTIIPDIFGYTPTMLSPSRYVSEVVRSLLREEVGFPKYLSEVLFLNTGDSSFSENILSFVNMTFHQIAHVETVHIQRY